jgi:peptide deformylase
MIYELAYWPDPILKVKCEPVPVVTDAVRWFLVELEETMLHEKGIGLAAPQVGRPLRAITVRLPDSGLPFSLVNPVIIERSPEETRVREGCLSLPGYFEMVNRARWVRVEGLTKMGERAELRCDGLLGQVFQHEVEHLDGIVFVDHLSALKRDIARKKVRKELFLRSVDPKEYEERGLANEL